MEIYTTPVLGPWLTFFAMTGASAATLTGLMFVVVTLVMRNERLAASSDGFSTFSTPTVVHFGAVLLISAILCAPWPSFIGPIVMVAGGGLIGIVHMARVIRRTRRLTSYMPDTEDWIWYSIVPFAAYLGLFGAGLAMLADPSAAMFVAGGSVVLLIFAGIRNSWDVVSYIAVGPGAAPE